MKSSIINIIILTIVVGLSGCQKEKSIPSVTTASISSITSESALAGGSVTSDGGDPVTARGVCWNTAASPSVLNSKSALGTGTGAFSGTISGLSPGTLYYVRAYATNGVGTAYGSEVTFTTSIVLPTITTTAATSVTSAGATAGGNITNDGGSSVTARGVCWNTSAAPTVSNSKTTDGTGTGSFTSSITGLNPGITYFFRAYATNSAGTVYGNELTFTTQAILPSLTTTAVTSITSTSALSGGNITADGGGTLTARGVCWSTNQNPVTTDFKTNDVQLKIFENNPFGAVAAYNSPDQQLNVATGSYSSSLTSLTPGVLYYVRAYATNSAGTAYGNQLSFTTLATAPVITTTNVSSITTTSAVSGGNISSDGGGAITAKGVCWGTSQNPTVSGSKTTDGSGTGAFTSTMTSLQPGTLYYVRAYATNSAGTSYGNQVSFTALANLPVISTANVSAISTNSATSGGTVTSDGGGAITAKGVCWSTSQNPTTGSSKTNDGTGSASFTSNLTTLQQGTLYYVRAYATNSAGTAYGDQKSFTTTTSVTVPVVTTTSITSITSATATGGGNITSDGGNTITARGVCWSTSSNPTVSNDKTSDGSGGGIFVSSIIGLSASTTYYVRAYATYSGGSVYGDQVSFQTLAQLPAVTTSAVGSITSSTVRTGGNVTSSGGATVTARGVCWSTSPSPTVANSKSTNGTGVGTFTSYVTGLTPGTTYYLRAYATNSGGTQYGTQETFATASASAYYEDGEYVTYQTNSAGTNPCEILIVGDGYQSTDYATGGLFDQNANEGIAAFFNVEPYNTYKNYFKVYKMAAFSYDSGVTQTDLSITKNTVFNTQYTGGSGITVDDNSVFNYAMTLPGMTTARLRNLLIIVMINQNRYAGTCFMWSDGKAIALCPVSRNSNTLAQFGAIVNHEAGGHGWGRLADEYINNTGQTLPASEITTFNAWVSYGYYPNVDLTNNLTTIKWNYLVGVSGYDRVGAFEGAFYYSYGAWRAENTSCMINNIPYYSAPSREAQVKKIMSVSGGTYSLSNFISNDVQKAPAAVATLLTKSFNPLTFVPLAPPVMKK